MALKVKDVTDVINKIIQDLPKNPNQADALYKPEYVSVAWHGNSATTVTKLGASSEQADVFFQNLPAIEYNAAIQKLVYAKEYSIFYAFIFTVYPKIINHSPSDIHKIVSEFRKQFTKDSITHIIANNSPPKIKLEEFVQELFEPKPQQIVSNILHLLSSLYGISIIVIEPTAYDYNGKQIFSEVHPFINLAPKSAIILYYHYVSGYANLPVINNFSTVFAGLASYKEDNLVKFALPTDLAKVQRYFQWLILQRGISYDEASPIITTAIQPTSITKTDTQYIINDNFTMADAFRHRLVNFSGKDTELLDLICKPNGNKSCISIIDLLKNGHTIPAAVKHVLDAQLFTPLTQPVQSVPYTLKYDDLQQVIVTLCQFNNIEDIKKYAATDLASNLSEFINMLIHSIILLKEVTDALVPYNDILTQLKTSTNKLFMVLATSNTLGENRNGIVDLVTILEQVISDTIRRQQKLDDDWYASMWQYVLMGAAGLAIGGLMARIRFVKRGQNVKNNKRERKMV
jgi:hypothetical protein